MYKVNPEVIQRFFCGRVGLFIQSECVYETHLKNVDKNLFVPPQGLVFSRVVRHQLVVSVHSRHLGIIVDNRQGFLPRLTISVVGNCHFILKLSRNIEHCSLIFPLCDSYPLGISCHSFSFFQDRCFDLLRQVFAVCSQGACAVGGLPQ
ncbi:hypothetical protein J6590_108798 [Homalodisca vitripennis]|nr:hypothetical protein J6590_108703 [Homalodisca vitripennis]KAG8318975.1 hypothetical protein J6590_108798 [Homalodisca vitripennis]